MALEEDVHVTSATKEPQHLVRLVKRVHPKLWMRVSLPVFTTNPLVIVRAGNAHEQKYDSGYEYI